METITRFERARLISARALQLALGAPALIKGDKNTSIYDIAKLELEQGILPLIVLREFPSGEIQRLEVV